MERTRRGVGQLGANHRCAGKTQRGSKNSGVRLALRVDDALELAEDLHALQHLREA